MKVMKKAVIVAVVLLLAGAGWYVYSTEQRLATLQAEVVEGHNSSVYLQAMINLGLAPTIDQVNAIAVQRASSTKR